MVTKGDTAPAFTAPLANGDVEQVSLSTLIDEDAPVVLAFFPGAFTSVCSHEMNTFQDRLDNLTEHGAALYGVSIDSPFSLNEFRDQLDLSFGLLSDVNRDLVRAYDVATDFEDVGVEDIAQRAVFVIDETGTVTYSWVGENAGLEPDYDEVESAVAEAA
jgi:peroxiredoxin